MSEALSAREEQLLAALAWMALQYLRDGDELDSLCISAGEHAIEALAEHGLVEAYGGGRCARWTEAGRRFLENH